MAWCGAFVITRALFQSSKTALTVNLQKQQYGDQFYFKKYAVFYEPIIIYFASKLIMWY